MPDFKLIKPHGNRRNKVLMLQAAYNPKSLNRGNHTDTPQIPQTTPKQGKVRR
jgi:hypothetical protein